MNDELRDTVKKGQDPKTTAKNNNTTANNRDSNNNNSTETTTTKKTTEKDLRDVGTPKKNPNKKVLPNRMQQPPPPSVPPSIVSTPVVVPAEDASLVEGAGIDIDETMIPPPPTAIPTNNPTPIPTLPPTTTTLNTKPTPFPTWTFTARDATPPQGSGSGSGSGNDDYECEYCSGRCFAAESASATVTFSQGSSATCAHVRTVAPTLTRTHCGIERRAIEEACCAACSSPPPPQAADGDADASAPAAGIGGRVDAEAVDTQGNPIVAANNEQPSQQQEQQRGSGEFDSACTFCAGKEFVDANVIVFSNGDDMVSCSGLMSLVRGGWFDPNFCAVERDSIEQYCCGADIDEAWVAPNTAPSPPENGFEDTSLIQPPEGNATGSGDGDDPVFYFIRNQEGFLVNQNGELVPITIDEFDAAAGATAATTTTETTAATETGPEFDAVEEQAGDEGPSTIKEGGQRENGTIGSVDRNHNRGNSIVEETETGTDTGKARLQNNTASSSNNNQPPSTVATGGTRDVPRAFDPAENRDEGLSNTTVEETETETGTETGTGTARLQDNTASSSNNNQPPSTVATGGTRDVPRAFDPAESRDEGPSTEDDSSSASGASTPSGSVDRQQDPDQFLGRTVENSTRKAAIPSGRERMFSHANVASF